MPPPIDLSIREARDNETRGMNDAMNDTQMQRIIAHHPYHCLSALLFRSCTLLHYCTLHHSAHQTHNGTIPRPPVQGCSGRDLSSQPAATAGASNLPLTDSLTQTQTQRDLGTLHSAFAICHLPFAILHSPFSILHSPFPFSTKCLLSLSFQFALVEMSPDTRVPCSPAWH